MSSSDESSDKECPLCMETLELDDISFFPCKCEYQICRFCWHRIRTDENGLCPACRQPYPDNPVNFQAITGDDVRKHKEVQRLKKQAEKLKVTEHRQYLCNYRVLQKNLVYVVGLSPRVADPDILKKKEYFGRYGMIQKVVTSATPSVPANVPPSHTAYVTFKRVEDALRAIQGVHNSMLDGRVVKASLGTTKYCSSFLMSRKCHKPECMYLHENAEDEISFTKEDMHIGKHTEYERKLIEAITVKPAPPQSMISSQLDKILTPTVNSTQNKRPAAAETAQGVNGSNTVTGVERTGSTTQISAKEPEEDTKSLNTNDVGLEAEAQGANDAQFQSVEDPSPSNLADETVCSRRSNATARERQWSERDQISVAPSNSPPTDPEVTEIEFEDEDINRCNLSERMSQLEVREDRLDRSLPYSEHDYQYTGIPAPANHQEAPAPLMQWGDLLGLTSHQTAAPPVIEPSSLFSSFKLDSFTSPALFSTPANLSNSFRKEPSPPPGLLRFNSDDDLGFDPFTESSKGLSELLQEEQEQIPPHSSSGSSLDVLKHSRLFGQMPEQRHQTQQSQHQQSHHHPLQQHQDQHHSFLQQLHSQQQHHQQQQQQQHQQQQQFADMSRQDFFSRMMQSQMQQHQQSQRPFESTPGFAHPFANMQQQSQQQHPAQSSQSSSLLQDLFNRQQQQQQQAQQVQQQQQQMYQGMNSFMYNDLMYPRVPFGMTPPPGLQAPSGNRASVVPPPHLAQSSMQQQSQQQQPPQQQSMGLFGMGHSLLSQQHPPAPQSAQDAFKALLPNVNVRFMDDNSMARWSHENSLRSAAAVAPPPGFSSMVNR